MRRPPPALAVPISSTDLVLAGALPTLPPTFDVPADLVEPARRFLAAARSVNTRRARHSDWAVFAAWCAERGRVAFPAGADTVFSFMADKAEREAKRPATLRRYLTSIATAHKGAGHQDPTNDARTVELMAGILNTLGGRQRQAAPLTLDVLQQLQPHASIREWAVLCFGQAIACRRSELCALNRADVVIDERGVAVKFQKSKTDQTGKGELIAVERRTALCPVAALEAYLAKRGASPGPLFSGARVPRMTTKDVDRIVKRAVAAAGLKVGSYSAHSLRAGYVTEERRQGRSWASIMEHTRHADLKTVKGYARYEVDPFARPKE